MNDIERAIKHFKNLKEKNFIVLNDFKKEIEMKEAIGNNNINYNMSIYENRDKHYTLAISALEKQLNGAWIPFKTEYDEDYNMDMLQGEIPDDEQEILVTDGECVWSDTFMRDGMECYLDSGNDLIITVKAWMKLPEPYKEVESE